MFWKKRLSNEEIKAVVAEADDYRIGRNGKPKDIGMAAKKYEMAAENGNAYAALLVGYMYDFGDGVRNNPEKALKYYSVAAEQNDSNALLNLGNMFYAGRGVEVDVSKAMVYYEKAALLGSGVAASNLGEAYTLSDNPKRSTTEAERWINKAEERGYANVQTIVNLGCLFADEGDDKKAVELFCKAVDIDSSNQNAQFMLAKHRFLGRGTPVDMEDAAIRFNWLVDSFDDKDAKNFLAWKAAFDDFKVCVSALKNYVVNDLFGGYEGLSIHELNDTLNNKVILIHAGFELSRSEDRNIGDKAKKTWETYKSAVSWLKEVLEWKQDGSFTYFTRSFHGLINERNREQLLGKIKSIIQEETEGTRCKFIITDNPFEASFKCDH